MQVAIPNLERLIWIVPLILLGIAVVQALYLVWLRITFSPTDRTPPRERRSERLTGMYPAVETQSVPPISTSSYSSQAPSSAVPSSYPSSIPSGVYRAAPSASSQGGVMAKRLKVLSGLPDTGEMTLPDGDFSIGRYFNLDANVIVAFDEKSISRKHANFLADDKNKEYHLIDTNSSYGTYVLIDNRFEALTPGMSERLYNEDVIQLGNNVKVRIFLPCETRSSTTRV